MPGFEFILHCFGASWDQQRTLKWSNWTLDWSKLYGVYQLIDHKLKRIQRKRVQFSFWKPSQAYWIKWVIERWRGSKRNWHWWKYLRNWVIDSKLNWNYKKTFQTRKWCKTLLWFSILLKLQGNYRSKSKLFFEHIYI